MTLRAGDAQGCANLSCFSRRSILSLRNGKYEQDVECEKGPEVKCNVEEKKERESWRVKVSRSDWLRVMENGVKVKLQLVTG